MKGNGVEKANAGVTIVQDGSRRGRVTIWTEQDLKNIMEDRRLAWRTHSRMPQQQRDNEKH